MFYLSKTFFYSELAYIVTQIAPNFLGTVSPKQGGDCPDSFNKT
jgi:hypothetical protein